jgi:ribonuclease P protein component
MLAAQYRLTKQKDFARLKKGGQTSYSGLFKLVHQANLLAVSRFAVVVSTQVSKKATDRNRLKRQCLEIIRLQQSKIKPGFDVLLMVSRRALNVEYRQLEKQLLAILTKAHLLA